jgi:hypothetical protein
MLNGTCHCGALSWNLEGDPGSITACNCTLCREVRAGHVVLAGVGRHAVP